MHHARLKQRFYMHTDFTCIWIVPMHGFMKNSDYSCTVSMHVQKIQKIEFHFYSMHHARLNIMHTDFTSIRIVPMHGFMKNSDYSCTVTMHVQKKN